MRDREQAVALKVASDWNQNPGKIPQSLTVLLKRAMENCPCDSPIHGTCPNFRACRSQRLACQDFLAFTGDGKYLNENRDPDRHTLSRVFSDEPKARKGDVTNCSECGEVRTIKVRGMCQSCYHHAPKRKKATTK